MLEHPLKSYYPEVDVVATPSGRPVAMAHANTCTSEIDAWVNLIADTAHTMGWLVDKGERYTKLFRQALNGEPDCGGMVAFNYFTAEPLTKTKTGRPMLIRLPDSRMNIANLIAPALWRHSYAENRHGHASP